MGFLSCVSLFSTIKISSPTRMSLWSDCKIRSVALNSKTMLPSTIWILSKTVCFSQPLHRCVAARLLSQMDTIRARFQAMTVTRYFRSLQEVAGRSQATNILAMQNKEMNKISCRKVSAIYNAEYLPYLSNSHQIDLILVISTWLWL